jgi:hypothetical protein
MICPNCRAEYRDGFTHCADCDVELVELSAAALATAQNASSAAETEDPFCEFWKGEDARVRGELCDILGEAGIPVRTLEWQDHLFNRTRLPVFRVAVPFSMFDRAETVVAEAYGSAEQADDVMHPTEANRPEFRKLLALPMEEKFRQVKWKRKETQSEPEQENPGREDDGSES